MHGAPKEYIKVAQSGNRRVQAFCGECGTPLFAKAPENAAEVNIRLGCVRQRAELAPRRQLWTASTMPWLAGLLALPGAPDQGLAAPAQRGNQTRQSGAEPDPS